MFYTKSLTMKIKPNLIIALALLGMVGCSQGESIQGRITSYNVCYTKLLRPEYFAKVINSTNWIGIDVKVGDDELDLARCQVTDFRRVLNMKEGYLERSFICEMPSGVKIAVNAKRFLSLANSELGAT